MDQSVAVLCTTYLRALAWHQHVPAAAADHLSLNPIPVTFEWQT
jgi:hypothetical protein